MLWQSKKCKNTSSVKEIKDFAFSNCNKLFYITIPNGVTNIGVDAFENCDSLKTIEIPSSVTSIGDGAFSGCISLTSIEIPSSVTSIGEGAFGWCYNVASIIIPENVKCIGDNINDRCNYINTNLYDVTPFLFGEVLDKGTFQSNDGVSFYKVKSPKTATDTVIKDATSTATISPTGDISVLMIITMLAMGTVGMAKTRLVRK